MLEEVSYCAPFRALYVKIACNLSKTRRQIKWYKIEKRSLNVKKL